METVVSNNSAGSFAISNLWLDKLAIGLSAVCAIHCLMLPVALAVMPSLALLPLGGESFHKLLICLVLPASILALTLGCRRHGKKVMLFWGGAGLFIMILTAILGHDLMGELLEKAATVIGATFVAVAHVINYRSCRSAKCQH